MNEIGNGDYKVSNTFFLSFVVKSGETLIEIKLNTNTYNYMIVGNRIDKHLIKYFLTNMGYNCDDYVLQIMTSDINVFEIGPSNDLVVNENYFSLY